jgi:Fe-S cluster assembly protein SufD
MTETPVIVRRSRQSETAKSTRFNFDDAQFSTNLCKDELQAKRKHAWKIYQTKALPINTEEAWRRTDISKLDPAQFSLQVHGTNKDQPSVPADILQPLTDQDHAGQIILYGADAISNVTDDLKKKGIVFSTFSDVMKTNPKLLEKFYGEVVKPEEGLFPSLVHALAQDGIFLYIPENVKLDLPLHSLFWGTEKEKAYLSHVIVVLEKNAEATYIHETASLDTISEPSMHAGVVEIHVGENARLQFVELQSLGKNVWNFSNERARVEANGTIEWTFGAIGSHVTKNFTDLDLAGQGSKGKMSGFYFTNGTQHLDHDTQQNHLASRTTSDMLFKGALLDNSRSVWQGMIYVAPEAQKTDGYQANRNLILSKNAHADSLPGLEILADDVRCTHGATVGKIDKDEVFYLLSRGIPQKEAERLIVEGFFDPIMQRIPFEGVRNRFQQYIHDKMAI